MSRLAWAAADVTSPDNPDTSMAQIGVYWDEVPASYLGADDMSNRRDEGDDTVAVMKEMLSSSTLGWTRNTEVVNQDGTRSRSYDFMSTTNESVFFGNTKCTPVEVDPGFRRRVCFKTCVQFERADGVSFERVKEKERESREDTARAQWTAALRDNAKLHLLVATAEYCGIIEPPDLSIWNVMEQKFRLAVMEYVHATSTTASRMSGRDACFSRA